jgi:DNA-binding MarR family transcriptional regulator
MNVFTDLLACSHHTEQHRNPKYDQLLGAVSNWEYVKDVAARLGFTVSYTSVSLSVMEKSGLVVGRKNYVSWSRPPVKQYRRK